MSKLDSETKIVISKSLQIMEVFRRLDNTMPLAEAMSFLMIANQEDITLQDLMKSLDYALSTASRHSQHLGKLDRNRERGLELISETTDPMDRRKTIRTLTKKGENVLAQLSRAFFGFPQYQGER